MTGTYLPETCTEVEINIVSNSVHLVRLYLKYIIQGCTVNKT